MKTDTKEDMAIEIVADFPLNPLTFSEYCRRLQYICIQNLNRILIDISICWLNQLFIHVFEGETTTLSSSLFMCS